MDSERNRAYHQHTESDALRKEKLLRKEFFELSPEQQREIAALAALPDDQIDTTDIPEVRDWSHGKRGVFSPPPANPETRTAEPQPA